MTDSVLKDYYEKTSHRFWDPTQGMTGRDLDVYPLLQGMSGCLLEYGCGSGSLLMGLAKEARFSKCYGIDISQRTLSILKAAWDAQSDRNPGKVEVMVPDGYGRLGLASGSIDVVVSVATIEHVVDMYAVLDELHRLANDHGFLVCSVPNYAYIKHRLQLLFGIQPRTGTDEPVEKWREVGWDGMHLHTLTKSSFAVLLKNCGWEPIRWLGCGQRFNRLGIGYLRRNFPGLWSGELIALCRKVGVCGPVRKGN